MASATTWAPIDGCAVLVSLKVAATTAQRLNTAVKAGGVPALVVDLLDKLEDSGLAPHFTGVGTHALFACEAAAGVRVVADIKHLGKFMLRLLQEVDPSFVRKDLQAETAINAKGFEADFLRRMQ